MRLAAGVLVAASALGTVGIVPAQAQARSEPGHRRLDAAAALTSDEVVRIGLAPLIAQDATLRTFPVGVRRFSGETHLDQQVFATSAGGRDERDAMVFIDVTSPARARVDCGFDEDVRQRRLSPTTCIGTQTPSGDRQPQFVAYGSMPAPGINVTAVVGGPSISENPTWTTPSTATRLALARKLVTAQVAKLRAQGYLR